MPYHKFDPLTQKDYYSIFAYFNRSATSASTATAASTRIRRSKRKRPATGEEPACREYGGFSSARDFAQGGFFRRFADVFASYDGCELMPRRRRGDVAERVEVRKDR